jgi:hypothetical protein
VVKSAVFQIDEASAAGWLGDPVVGAALEESEHIGEESSVPRKSRPMPTG